MKKSILIAILILSGFSSFSIYVGTHLPRLIETSKIIVYGKIVFIDSISFKIVVLKRINYISKTDTLSIQKFNNWKCAERYSEYAIGQEAIYFLEINKDNKFQTIGGGNEGELIVRSDSTYLKDYDQKRFPSKKVSFLSKYSTFIVTDLTTTIHGIKIYFDNLQAINAELKQDAPGTTVYRHNTIEKLPKNSFLNIILDQKQRGIL
ncbi:MAG: hypothetical protein K0S32_1553 [Bacteroidetes bacterium]|nr:hypothetical protein [Bacteroidota bacterium]